MTDIDITAVFEFSPGQGLPDIQAEYQDKLYGYMADYLQSSKSVVIDRNLYNRAINDAFTMAFVAGWADAGASGPITSEAQAWLNGRISQEIAFAATLFSDLKALRGDDTIPLQDKLSAAQMHAEAYTATLTGVYAQAKMMGDPEKDGTWQYGDTDHCDTCANLNGQTHPLSWYIKNDYIPQQAGSQTLDCGGWRCMCRILGKDGAQLIP
jgi:hypothetical protein